MKWEGVDWISLIHDRDKCVGVAKILMKLWVP